MDKAGQVVIKPQYEEVSQFGEGLTAVKRSGKWGYIDQKGKWVVRPIYNKAYPFKKGDKCARVQDDYNYLWGLINNKGLIVRKIQFDKITEFDRGIAQVLINGMYGLINEEGLYVINPIKVDSFYFPGYAEHIAAYYYLGEKEYTILLNSFLIVDSWHYLNNNRDLVAIRDLTGKWGIINKWGEIVHKPQYEELREPQNKTDFFVKINGKWGVIDDKFNLIIKPQFDDVSYFSEGKTGDKVNDK